MMNMTNRARWIAVAGLAAVVALAVAACNVKDELLAAAEPRARSTRRAVGYADGGARAPGRRDRPLQAASSTAAATECSGRTIGTLTDEYKNADFQTDRVRTSTSGRSIRRRSVEPLHRRHAAARVRARRDRGDAGSIIPDSTALIGELYTELGFLEMSLAENFCNGIPLGHTIAGVLTFGRAADRRRRCYDSASAHLDTALR